MGLVYCGGMFLSWWLWCDCSDVCGSTVHAQVHQWRCGVCPRSRQGLFGIHKRKWGMETGRFRYSEFDER